MADLVLVLFLLDALKSSSLLKGSRRSSPELDRGSSGSICGPREGAGDRLPSVCQIGMLAMQTSAELSVEGLLPGWAASNCSKCAVHSFTDASKLALR